MPEEHKNKLPPEIIDSLVNQHGELTIMFRGTNGRIRTIALDTEDIDKLFGKTTDFDQGKTIFRD